MSGGEENVFGFYVAVDYPLRVRIGECIGDVARYAACGFWRELPLAIHSVTQGLAAHVRHHVVEKVFYVSGVVQGKDVGMLKAGEHSDLANETQLACI
jgi:hypothetical protein